MIDAAGFVADLDRDLSVEDLYGKETVVNKKTGAVRQAGAEVNDTKHLELLRTRAEDSLYVFTKGVLARSYLIPRLHQPIADFIQRTPPYRKLVLLPRRHGKTSLVSHGLPLHVIVQSKSTNCYLPGVDGADVRMLLVGETERRAMDNLRVIQTVMEQNDLFRAFWPHRCWDNPQRQSKKWNERELLVPREATFPDPTIRAIGVGGAITGARHDLHIKDDLISVEAANSAVTMQGAIDWHIASRALLDHDTSLEVTAGTRWAVHDLYSYIMQNDPSVAVMLKGIIEDGKTIWPEAFSEARIQQLRAEFGVLFSLLYMNDPTDPALADFAREGLRFCTMTANTISFYEDERDEALAAAMNRPKPRPDTQPLVPRGTVLNRYAIDELLVGRHEYLRFKY